MELKKIEDQEAQRVSLAKRRKGLVKKCIELSVMCSQDIFVVIYDQEKQKLVEYRSDDSFDVDVVSSLLDRSLSSVIKKKNYSKLSISPGQVREADRKVIMEPIAQFTTGPSLSYD